MDGPDQQASMEPSDFSKLKTEIEEAFSIGNGVKRIMPTETIRSGASVVLKTDVKGERIETDMFAWNDRALINQLSLVMSLVSRDLSADTMLKFEDLD